MVLCLMLIINVLDCKINIINGTTTKITFKIIKKYIDSIKMNNNVELVYQIMKILKLKTYYL